MYLCIYVYYIYTYKPLIRMVNRPVRAASVSLRPQQQN